MSSRSAMRNSVSSETPFTREELLACHLADEADAAADGLRQLLLREPAQLAVVGYLQPQHSELFPVLVSHPQPLPAASKGSSRPAYAGRGVKGHGPLQKRSVNFIETCQELR